MILFLLNCRQPVLQLGEAIADLPPIELDRRVTRAAPLLAFAAARRLAQPWRQVVEPRDLDLHPRLPAAGVAVKDVDDHRCAVEHRRAGRLLEVAQLAGRQLVIDDHHRGPLLIPFSLSVGRRP